MIYTFGHSTLDEDSAAEILTRNNIHVLVDIRSHPTSKWEQWRQENTQHWLRPKTGIRYVWMPELGGWDERHMPHANLFARYGVDLAAYSRGKFPKQRISVQKPDVNPESPSWTNQGLWDYQFFMTLPEFTIGITYLRRAFDNDDLNCAIMCCEVLWWKCHRSMVADYLYVQGVDVYHLQPKLTYHAAAIGNRVERYHSLVRDFMGVKDENPQEI